MCIRDRVDTDVYDVHDLIREFLVRSIDEQTKQSVHSTCASYYSKLSKSSETTLEQIYHELASERQQEAIEKIVEFGRQLVSQGHLELLSLIESVTIDRLDASLMAPMMQLQGDILLMLGRFEQASSIFETASKAAKESNLPVVYSEILGSQADIAMKQGQTDKALSSHKEALEVQVVLGDAKGAARTYNCLLYTSPSPRDRSLSRMPSSA